MPLSSCWALSGACYLFIGGSFIQLIFVVCFVVTSYTGSQTKVLKGVWGWKGLIWPPTCCPCLRLHWNSDILICIESFIFSMVPWLTPDPDSEQLVLLQYMHSCSIGDPTFSLPLTRERMPFLSVLEYEKAFPFVFYALLCVSAGLHANNPSVHHVSSI